MSVTPNNIVAYGSVNMPEVDGVAVGGSVDFTKRVAGVVNGDAGQGPLAGRTVRYFCPFS